jgi:hypothetical protein
MNPRVTVLMAVFNGARHIRDAIDSVLAQTFPDFELLIVDDASTDDTIGIVESYRDPRIRLLRNERNLNQSASLNRGLRTARASYVARLDHDDVCLPERLERQVRLLDERPEVGVVGVWMVIRDEEGRSLGMLAGTVGDFADWLWALLSSRPLLGHPAVMFRRDAVLAVGGYDETMQLTQDRDLWNRLAIDRWHGAVIEEPLVHYRWHEAQKSQTKPELQHRASDRTIERLAGSLAGESYGAVLRKLCADDPAEFWRDPGAPRADAALTALELGARERLHFDEAQAAHFERVLAERARTLALSGWKAGATVQWRVGPALWRYAVSKSGRTRTPLFVAATVAAPLLHAGRRARIRITDAVHTSPRAEPLKNWGRRHERLTRLYRRVVSDR